jgi:hypothetical protein
MGIRRTTTARAHPTTPDRNELLTGPYCNSFIDSSNFIMDSQIMTAY